jgi:hypothetical protein
MTGHTTMGMQQFHPQLLADGPARAVTHTPTRLLTQIETTQSASAGAASVLQPARSSHLGHSSCRYHAMWLLLLQRGLPPRADSKQALLLSTLTPAGTLLLPSHACFSSRECAPAPPTTADGVSAEEEEGCRRGVGGGHGACMYTQDHALGARSGGLFVEHPSHDHAPPPAQPQPPGKRPHSGTGEAA